MTDWGSNAWLADELHTAWLKDPASVPPAWGAHFASTVASPQPEPPTVLAPGLSVPAALLERAVPLRGAAAALARNMDASLRVPTATSVRSIAVGQLEASRAAMNASSSAKTTFGHLITWAVTRAARDTGLLRTYHAGHVVAHEHVSVGIAVDVPRTDGTRSLVVPVLHDADTLAFAEFRALYDELVSRAQRGALTPAEMQGATLTVTNPGGIGTAMSVPRLMEGQACIVAVGAIAWPAGFGACDPAWLTANGVERVVTLTNTYDHRVIQGADSGRMLARAAELLAGADGFYAACSPDAAAVTGSVTETPKPSASTPATPVAPAVRALPLQSTPDASALAVERWRAAFAELGHTWATLDPLAPRADRPEMLDPRFWGLDPDDPGIAALDAELEATWAGTCALQATHLPHDRREWLHRRFSKPRPAHAELSDAAALTVRAATFELFLARKWVGQKRFGLEGLDTLVPLVSELVAGSSRVFIGMPHRGRLNVLAHITHKPYEEILAGFDGQLPAYASYGAHDVKYHLGWEGTHRGAHVSVTPNPSHLEAVAPVVCGQARAHRDATGADAMALVIHGDASVAAQGVVFETLALSGLDAYDTGGVIHVVADNHVGFTTSPHDARAQRHAPDALRGFELPVLHANADDLAAVVHVARVARAWRDTFHTDVVVHLSGYRRNGHNEGDDASYTQPLEHAAIQAHPPVTGILAASGFYTDASALLAELDEALVSARSRQLHTGIAPVRLEPLVARARPVDHAELTAVLDVLDATPVGFSTHPKLARQLQARRAMWQAGECDWALAELLALGVTARAGHPVRLVGEDARRGTFAHRHAALRDVHTGELHVPLASLGDVAVFDSLLSEYAAMGFEYGYQLTRPDALVLWEAQFGDFANTAQVVIDQFLAAGEDKWGVQNGLVLLLPHGYEGQGPEHSSARLERFLQLAANGAIRVCQPSTAAQWFHLLHEHASATPRRPLVVMTPKQPLRMHQTRSSVEALTHGAFAPVLADPARPVDPARVVLCSGKLAWDLFARRDETGAPVEILRVEQLHPFPPGLVELVSAAPEVVWAQDEPLNQGAWRYVQAAFTDAGASIRGTGRAERGSPATGLKTVSDAEASLVVTAALGLDDL